MASMNPILIPQGAMDFVGPIREEWMDDAHCLGVSTELFFEEKGGSALYAAARTICKNCPVVQDCLIFTMTKETPGTRHGYAGGTTPAERQAIFVALTERHNRERQN